MEAVEILKREHHTALLVVGAARRDLALAHETYEIAEEELERILHFFRYFTNSCHNPKEEDLLFTALHRRGVPWDAYPLRELVQEHQQMRVVLDSASDWLALVKAGDPTALPSLVYDLETYFDLLDSHVAAEEATLFPIAEELLTRHDVEELSDAFAMLACEELKGGVYAYYTELAGDLAGAAG